MSRFSSARRIVICIALLFALRHTAHAQFSKAAVLLSGTVTDAESGQPLRARLTFTDGGGAAANKVLTNPEGKYQAVLKPGVSYTLNVFADQRYLHSEPISFPENGSYQQPTHNIALKPIHAGTVMFGDVCFDFGGTSPTAAAAAAVAAVGKAMKLNEAIEVKIETFSDAQLEEGPPVAPDQGTRRADALKKILVANGAAPNRVQTLPHNPPPVVKEEEEPAPAKGKKGKKKKVVKKKKKVTKKHGRGKKEVEAPPPQAKATITIIKVHSEDE